MSQNNTIRKSDKKFIRLEKARIRAKFFDTKKRQELIDNLYKKFMSADKMEVVKPAVAEGSGVAKKEKKVTAKVK